MPAIATGKILVTGANGYVAVWVIKQLLDQGFSVRGTIRSADKGRHLKATFDAFSPRLELVVVKDFTKTDAFDEAIRGVDAAYHIASPFHLNAIKPSEIIIPAVSGTCNFLRSAQTYGDKLKRVVIVSSTTAVFELTGEARVYTEENWNDNAVFEVATKGKGADQFTKYCASKTLAERAAWGFYINYKHLLNWDMVIINPPYVFGPILHRVETISSLNTSLEHWFHYVLSGRATDKILANEGNCWIDVRDLATALILATREEKAGDQRIVVSAGPFKWQDWVSAVRDIHSDTRLCDKDSKPSEVLHLIQHDTSKASRILGLTYRNLENSARSMIANFEARGWWARTALVRE